MDFFSLKKMSPAAQIKFMLRRLTVSVCRQWFRDPGASMTAWSIWDAAPEFDCTSQFPSARARHTARVRSSPAPSLGHHTVTFVQSLERLRYGGRSRERNHRLDPGVDMLLFILCELHHQREPRAKNETGNVDGVTDIRDRTGFPVEVGACELFDEVRGQINVTWNHNDEVFAAAEKSEPPDRC